MLFDLAALLRQLRALAYKNVLVTVIRRPAGFLFSTYVFPIAILWFLIALPSLLSSSVRNGVSSPASVKSLAETVQERLIIVQPDNLGPDVSRVIDAFTESIPSDKVVFTNTESDLESLCATSLTGKSECHGAVVFVDSPLTPNTERGGSNGKAWRYTIRADPALDDNSFDATSHHGAQEDVYLPLQVAIDRAITNSTLQPEVFRFTEQTQAEATKADLQNRVASVSQVYAFALFAAYYLTIYRLTRFVTGERESGMSQLLDAMGGPMSPVSRVFAWLLVVDVLSIPCFIILGVIYGNMLFPTSSMGIVILWQVLLGLAVNSSTVFAASFFKTSRTSAIYVMGVFLILSIITNSYSQNLDPKPQFGGALFLSLFFPSSNHIFFVQQLSLWELIGTAVDLSTMPPSDPGLDLEYGINPAMLLGFLGLQILVYPCAAILVEMSMHGISNRKRTFPTEVASNTQYPFEAKDLHKKFYPGLIKRIFCCGRRGVNKALDGVSFRGQQGQITCLLGPNGSGKTTTLHMLSGFLTPSSGSIDLGVKWSQMGVCPQRDTFWEQLSVMEHIKIWSQIKSAKPLSSHELDELAESCDLGWKRTSRASTLSGGQKRKLQLACMFVGDSRLCLIDECTSGLDPLSRQAVWKILLQQRSRRTIILTTHFLDEVEILADDIVIMSKGKIKCQGPAAELTAKYGSGYTVAAPVNAPRAPAGGIPYSIHQDQVLYKTADSHSAARLCSTLSSTGATGLSVSSPSIEDVFMRVVDDVDGDLRQTIDTTGDSEFEMTPATQIGFCKQVMVILGKRFTILKHFWWPYFYAVVIVFAVTPQLQGMLMDYKQPPCQLVKTPMGPAETSTLSWDETCATSACDRLTLGPSSANSTLFDLVRAKKEAFTSIGADAATAFTVVQDDRSAFIDYIKNNVDENLGGLFLPSDDSRPLIGYRQKVGSSTAGVLANLWSQMVSGVDIITSRGTFGSTARPEGSSIGMIYVMFFAFVQAIYPAVFSLYPAMERSRKVRALEYANGVGRGPIWVAYGLFDFMWVLLISAGVTLLLSTRDLNGSPGVMFCVLALYGLTGVFTGYIISHFTNGPLKSFITTFALSIVFYAVSLLALVVGAQKADATQHDAISMGLAFGLNLIFPIGNVLRAMFIGLNILQFACSGDEISSTGSIYGLGGPLLYLILQSIALLLILINLENNKLSFFWRRKRPSRVIVAPTDYVPSHEVKSEQMRVKGSPDDLLQVLHVSKTFGALNAVDDVCFGLPRNDILALLGPNGAGKSTLVGMLSSQLVQDGGSIILCGDDARSPSAQRNLGVCPQHDAIDLMTTEEHLLFYARVKGVRDPKRNTKCIMAKLGLTPHKNKMAAKLSGGNKRKLSLAIALMGMPSVLILDEPTTAMDALAKRAFWGIVRSVAQDRSILLTTHSMEEADALATRTAIMKRRFLAIGTTEELRQKYSDSFHINLLLTSAPGSTQQEMEYVRNSIAEMVPGTELERDMAGGQIRLIVPGTESMGQLIGLLEDNKDRLGIAYSTVTNSTLENVFASVIKESAAYDEDQAVGLHGDDIPLKPLPSTAVSRAEESSRCSQAPVQPSYGLRTRTGIAALCSGLLSI